jgi:hypothetical protein
LPLAALAAVVAVAVLAWQAAHPVYPAWPGNGRMVKAFFERLQLLEQTRGTRYGMALAMNKPNDWPLVVNPGGPLKQVYVSPDGNDQNPGNRPDLPKRTMAAALETARWGAVVQAAHGIYNEALVVTRPVQINGGWDRRFDAPTAFPTVIDAREKQKAALQIIGNDLKPTVRISNTHFTNGGCPQECTGGAVKAWNVNLYLDGCVLEGNQAADGAGLFAQEAYVSLRHCTIRRNAASGLGGGIWAGDNVQMDIRHSRVTDNRAGAGGGIWAGPAARVTITASLFDANTPDQTQGIPY